MGTVRHCAHAVLFLEPLEFGLQILVTVQALTHCLAALVPSLDVVLNRQPGIGRFLGELVLVVRALVSFLTAPVPARSFELMGLAPDSTRFAVAAWTVNLLTLGTVAPIVLQHAVTFRVLCGSPPAPILPDLMCGQLYPARCAFDAK